VAVEFSRESIDWNCAGSDRSTGESPMLGAREQSSLWKPPTESDGLLKAELA